MPLQSAFTPRSAWVRCLAGLLTATSLAPADGGESTATPGFGSGQPWAFNLTAYLWLAGMKGNLTAGPVN